MNFHALRSFGFKAARGHYFCMTGDPVLAPSTLRSLERTTDFTYYNLSRECGEDIGLAVQNHPNDPVPWSKLRFWHSKLIEIVETAAAEFRASL